MAEEFRIPGLSKSIKDWDTLNKEFSQSVDLLLKVSQEGQKATSSFRTVNSIKEFQQFETTAKSAINGVSTAYKGLNQAQQAQLKSYKDQQRASLNLAAAEKAEAVEVEKLKLKRAELVKLSKQQAKEELGLVSSSKKTTSQLKSQREVSKQLTGQMVESVNAIGKQSDSIKKLNSYYANLERESDKLLKKQKEGSVQFAKDKIQKQQLAASTKQQAKEELGLVSAYDKVVAKMNIAGKTVQNLNAKKASGQKLSDKEQSELRQSTKEFNRYQNAVLKADASIGRFQRNVGNYPKGLKAAATAARSLASALGAVGGAFLFVNVMRNAVNRIREFDKAMQNIAGIMRTTREEIKDLEKEIIRVASASVKTSREVAELAENLVTLGKSKSEIKDLLEPVNNLAIGLETTSGEAAEFLVQTLNAFGASTSEAQKYADTIAGIRTSTSLDFQKMRDSFQYILPVSRLLNKDLEYTGALLGVVADSGIKAEQAGRLLASAQLRLSKSGRTLQDGLDDINKAIKEGRDETEVLAIATDVFGVNAAKVGATLAVAADKVEVYENRIRGANGALDDLVNEQLKSLDAEIKILDSSWERFILSIENGNGTIARNFSQFIGWINKTLTSMSLLEEAQSKVFELTGKEDAYYKKFLNIVFTAGLYKTETEELVDKQREFNALLNDLSGQKLPAYEDALMLVNNNLENNNDLSESMVKLYKSMSKELEEIIKSKKEEAEANKDGVKYGKKKTESIAKNIKWLREQIKTERESIENIDLSVSGNLNLIKSKQDLIKKYQDEIDAILGTNKAREKEYDSKKEIFDLEKSRLERQIRLSDEAQKNESKSQLERLEANQVFQQKTQELIDLTSKYEINNAQGRKNVIIKIQEETETAKTEALRRGSQERTDIILGDFEGRLKELSKIQDANDSSIEKETLKIKQSLLDKGETTEKIELAITAFKETERKKQLQQQIDFALNELKIIAVTAEQKEKIERELLKLKKELLDIEFNQRKTAEDKASDLADENKRDRLEKLQEYEDSVRSAFEGIGEALGISGDNLATIFLGIENGFENAGDAAKAFGQLATEVLNSLASAENARIEARLEGLQVEKETALQFAGDSAAAKEEIEKQYDAKRRALKNKQFKSEKDAAVISSIINTASAVIEALPNIPLSIAVGFIGAAQTSIIASQKTPEFFKGTEDTGSGGNVDSKGGFNAILHPHERVMTAKQNKNLKGYSNDDITNIVNNYSNGIGFMAELKKLTSMSNIMFDTSLINIPEMPEINIEANGISQEEYSKGVNKIVSTIKNKSSIELVRDEHGYQTFLKTQNARTRLLNNKINIRK